MKRTILAIGIILLLVGLNFSSIPGNQINNQTIKSFDEDNILFIGSKEPDIYSSIENAIDDTNDINTKLIYDDSSPYPEYDILKDKSIKQVGEKKDTTTINDALSKSQMFTFEGNTLYVGGSGPGNYTHIQDAIDDAHWNDTIYVFDDSSPYYETIYIEKSIKLIGENKETTIIEGDNDVVYLHIVDNVTITGFTIQNSREGDFGIELWKSCNNTIQNNIFKNSSHGLLLFYESNYNYVCDNYFLNTGMYVSSAYHNTINDNYVNNKPLIFLERVHNKVIEEEDVGQIILLDCYNITVRNQNISNTSIAIELYKSHKCRIYNNSLHDNDYGVYLKRSDLNLIYENNLLENFVGLGLFDFSDANTVTNCKINSNTGCGIAFIHAEQNTIEENIIKNNGLILAYENSGGINFGLHTENNIISGNIISNNYNGVSRSLGTGNNISRNIIKNNSINGIFLSEYADETEIISNHIEGNGKRGLFLDKSFTTIIRKNNFIDNPRNIFFECHLWEGKIFKWSENYYDDYKGFGSKMILGYMKGKRRFGGYRLFSWILWINYDINPAKEPYDITTPYGCGI